MSVRKFETKTFDQKNLLRKAADKGRILFIKNKLWCMIVFNISSANVDDQNVILYILF